MCQLSDKVVIVTGGGGGIGSASARAFAAAGAAVVVADRDHEAAGRVAVSLAAGGHRAVAMAVDITDRGQVERLVGDVIDWGGGLDVVHNNAGIFRPEGRIEDLDERTWGMVYRVNTLGTALMCSAAVRHMLTAGGGAIVNTSSAHGRLGDEGWTSYSVAKAGVEALTRSVAAQYGTRGIRCNAIAPGLIDTEGALTRLPTDFVEGMRRHNLLARLGRPEEIAAVAVFLASDSAAFMTGQVLHVDGGLTVGMPHLGAGRDSA